MHKPLLHFYYILFAVLLFSVEASGQIGMPQNQRGSGFQLDRPTEYEIGGITVTGTRYLDEDLLLAVTGLSVGDKLKLPSDDKISKAIRTLW